MRREKEERMRKRENDSSQFVDFVEDTLEDVLYYLEDWFT
jgi:hypothetical protein